VRPATPSVPGTRARCSRALVFSPGLGGPGCL